MRIESSVLSVSWIPSEAVTGLPKQVFEAGVTHYDEPPPDHITPADLDELRAAARFRFANDLQAWIEVQDGKIVDCGYAGSGHMGLTTVSVVGKSATFEPVALPDLQHEPEVHGSAAKFVQTTGGRAPLPAPRTVKHPPFFQLKPPDVWTTLELTIHADGTSAFEVAGASKFPRHWVYDSTGALAAKAGLADFGDWYRTQFGKHTPWGARLARVRHRRRDGTRAPAVDHDHAGRHRARDPHGEEEPPAVRAGRPGRRAVPAARRRARRHRRRRAARRGRPRRDPR